MSNPCSHFLDSFFLMLGFLAGWMKHIFESSIDTTLKKAQRATLPMNAYNQRRGRIDTHARSNPYGSQSGQMCVIEGLTGIIIVSMP